MASRFSSNSRRRSPRLNANLQIPQSDLKNGRRPPVRRGHIPNFGYHNLNPPRQRNMELDESYDSFNQIQDDDIEAIEEYEIDNEDAIVSDKKNLKWGDDMDACLIDSLVEQKLKGQKIGGNFTKAAYRATSVAVSTTFSIICEPAHVKNRVRTLKKHLAMMKDLTESKSGFGYNESNKMIEAEPQVWAEYIKTKPLASQYRINPVPNYKKLNELFGKDRATGSRAIGPKERQLQWAKGKNTFASGSDTYSLEEQGDKDDNVEPEICRDDNETSSSKAPIFSAKFNEEPKKKKTRIVDVVSEEIKLLRGGMDRIAAALEQGYTEEQLLEEIAEVGGMSEMSQMSVYQSLTLDEKSARAFHKCPVKKRKIWLLVKFGPTVFDV